MTRPRVGTRGRIGAAVYLITAVCLAGLSMSPLRAQPAAPGLEAAVAQLEAEARDLDELEAPEAEPTFERPHPTVASLDPSDASAILERMTDRFTGNRYLDTYIRWHLMHAVMQAGPDALRDGREEVRQLVRRMPATVRIELADERRYEPEEIAREFWRLRAQTATQVGYPPFDRTYHGRRALKHMAPGRRRQMEPIVERMEELRPQFRAVVDQEAVAFNRRIGKLDWLVRQYRGELAYVMLLTRDEGAPDDVASLIRDALQRQDRAAFDLTAFVYRAGLDGVLHDYDPAAFNGLRRTLEGLAENHDTFQRYQDGSVSPRGYGGRDRRNFADYAFHLIRLLEDGPTPYLGLADLSPSAPTPSPEAAPRDQPISPEQLTVEMIRRAAERGIEALYRREPAWTFHSAFDYRHIGSDSVRRQELRHETGNHALAGWAMTSAGEFYQLPRLRRRMNWVMTGDVPFTYDRAMRLNLLAQLPASPWGPYLERDARWLIQAMTPDGSFAGAAYEPSPEAEGDRANSQYAAMALAAAERHGFETPDEVWQQIDAYWRQTQDGASGGWSLGAGGGRGASFRGQVTGPMTAGGTAVLSVTERLLLGDRYVTIGEAPQLEHYRKGLDWLNRNFSLESAEAGEDFYYYMWTIQQLGLASGYRTFNNVDWYREVTAKLLNLQQDDGAWSGDKGEMVSTGFALLYLARANDPLPIAKVRFDGAWHNRPHDLYNYVQWMSAEYETPMFWQIIDPEAPTYALVENAMLYLASDGAFDLSEAQVAGLRRYLDAGGLLLLAPEGRGQAVFRRSAEQLLRQLYGEQARFRAADADHPAYHMHYRVPPTVRLMAYGNGIRPQVILFNHDVSRDLQADEPAKSNVFRMLANLYTYVTGKRVARARLDTNYVPEPTGKLEPPMTVVRLMHGGRADPEPHALRRLARLVGRSHQLDLRIEKLPPAELSDQPIAFMSVLGDAELTGAEVESIRAWLDGGGLLWLDPAGGGSEAVENVQEIVRRLYPDQRPRRLRGDDPLLSGAGLPGGRTIQRLGYRLMAMQHLDGGFGSSPMAVFRDGRPALFFAYEDLTTALVGLDHWGIYGYSEDTAEKLATNALLAALHGYPTSEPASAESAEPAAAKPPAEPDAAAAMSAP